ncbi:phage portal protein [Alistipes sp.]|uniref:phage portal protein n=1 Tax=Alistipes sp. TaxID=1872444 RepID=UPI003AB73FB7
MNFIDRLFTCFQNKTLNALGIERDLMALIKAKDISQAMSLMEDHDPETMQAIHEYNPELHAIMKRQDKTRKGQQNYRTEKLPRARQRYINEVELFFLLGNPIKWKLSDESGDADAFAAYKQFLREIRFDSNMRQAKRLAGAETQSAKLYHVYRNNATGLPGVKIVVLSKSKGYTLRPMFDQYGNMLAFGYGYYLKEGANTVEHFDIHTPTFIFRGRKAKIGWDVTPVLNRIGKINIIYYRQETAWSGLQSRIDREESIDSKTADTNNYFSDPMAVATADVIKSLPKADSPGKLIKLTSRDDRFEYLDPPTSSETRQQEKSDLKESILFDSFTPEFTPDKMVGLGTLSGDAIKRAMVLGYIKRDNRKEIYDELVDREKNLILAIMMNVTHIGMREKLANLKIEHEFSEPFSEDVTAKWQSIGKAYNDGVISLEEAVKLMGIADNPEEEVERIMTNKEPIISDTPEKAKTNLLNNYSQN